MLSFARLRARLRARLHAQLLDRLVTRPAFRAWAAQFWLTRPIARRRTRALFDLCAGFVYAQTLAACVELDLFERLATGPVAADALAGAVGVPPGPFGALLRAAGGVRLLTVQDGLVSLGPLGAAMVGNQGLVAMIRHHTLLYADLADPVGLLRGRPGSLGTYWAYAGAAEPGGLGDAPVAAYSRLMAASQPLVAAEVLAAFPLGGHRHVVDVGGGEGAFLAAAARTHPRLRGTVFDLPAVADRARARFAAAGLAERLDAAGGDVFRDALPAGADLMTLVRVIHDHDDGAAMLILAAAHRALAPGGTLLLAEPMAGTAGAGGAETYFSLYLLAMGSGQPRTRPRLAAMLHHAGFISVREHRTATPLLVRVMSAHKV